MGMWTILKTIMTRQSWSRWPLSHINFVNVSA